MRFPVHLTVTVLIRRVFQALDIALTGRLPVRAGRQLEREHCSTFNFNEVPLAVSAPAAGATMAHWQRPSGRPGESGTGCGPGGARERLRRR